MLDWTRSELMNSSEETFEFEGDLEIDDAEFEGMDLITGTQDVYIRGTGYFNSYELRFYVHYDVEGDMLCPDSISGELLEVPFSTGNDEVFSFEETDDEDVRVVSNEVIELLPAVIESILSEVPLQVTDVAPGDYPSGDGWRVISEEEFEEERRNQIDPRLAKLREFKQE